MSAIRFSDAQTAVAVIPEHPVRARRLEVQGTQLFAGLGIEVFDAIGAWPADPECSTSTRAGVDSTSGGRRVKLRLVLHQRRRLLARRVRAPLQTVNTAFAGEHQIGGALASCSVMAKDHRWPDIRRHPD